MALSNRCARAAAAIVKGAQRLALNGHYCGYPPPTADRTLPTMLVNILHRIGDGADILSILVLDLEVELLLHCHDDFDEVQRIGIEIADELGVHRYLVFVDAEPV